jgi:catechol 2,3-dioxygenase
MASYGIAPPNFRLPDDTNLGRVRLQVSDLQRSVGYYEDVVGLRILRSGGSIVELGPDGADRVIVELDERPGARPVPRRGRLGLFHFAILLPDRASLGRFVTHLAEHGEYAGMSDHFVSEAVYLTDPDGLGIEVYADRPRNRWRQQDRQLYMTTVPLDVRDLVRAGGNERWRGMPSGTVLGHVHLHVADIDRAGAFYHDGLGLDKVVWNYPGALFMSAGGYHHHLGTNIWAAEAPRATDGDARLLDWEVVVPDAVAVEGAARSLERAGAEVSRAGDTASATDPWGTQVTVRPRGSPAFANGSP